MKPTELGPPSTVIEAWVYLEERPKPPKFVNHSVAGIAIA
jgi:hypothetical protein